MPNPLSIKLQPLFASVYSTLIVALPFGVVVAILYGLQAATFTAFCGIVATSLLLGGAAFGGGGFFGFLFSLPRMAAKKNTAPEERTTSKTEDEAVNPPTEDFTNYARNANLVDISDWLTKILVGAGLVQLSSIAGGLQNLGQSLAPALGNFPSSAAFAIGILLYYAVCGFLALYLWNVLVLPPLMSESDRQRIERATEIGARQQNDSWMEFLSKSKIVSSAVQPSPVAPREWLPTRETPAPYALWVDDMPSNNDREQATLERLFGLRFKNVLSTKEALSALDAAEEEYCLVISDMGRPEGPRAGYTLLEELRAQGNTIPYIIYASSGRPEHDAEARRRGALGSTNDVQRLLELVSKALESCNRKET